MSNATPSRDPKYRRHASGQARVTIAGKTYYLGKYGSQESKEAYNRLLAQWRANNCNLPQIAAEAKVLVEDIILAYWNHAQQYYVKNGSGTKELTALKSALHVLRQLHGTTPAADFGPLALKAVREKMIEGIRHAWCRRVVNANLQRVKRMFKWAVENELVPGSAYHALQAVAGLRRGRSNAADLPKVKPVPELLLEGAREHVSLQVRAMIDLQLLTGMRPGEACIMRGQDLEMSGDVWIYRPSRYKTEHHEDGAEREIYLGPRAQEVVRPFLRAELHAYLFSPSEAEAERLRALRANRKSKVQPSQACRKQRNPSRTVGDVYDVPAYRRAIARACAAAFPPAAHLQPQRLENGKLETKKQWRARLTVEQLAEARIWRRLHQWNPHRLRHNAATNLRRQYGIELARIVLGHRDGFTTEIYAETDKKAAMEAIGNVG